MGATYFISDHHLGHNNIRRFKDSDGNLIRPGFSDVNYMNDHIIEEHNKIVKPEDKVYIGGDIVFKRKYLPLVRQLIGRKILIRGNHDNLKLKDYAEYFDDVVAVKCYNDHGIIISHYPIHEGSLWQHRRERPIINVHGHTHQNILESPQYINMCVEPLNYRPMSFDELLVEVEKRRKLLQIDPLDQFGLREV